MSGPRSVRPVAKRQSQRPARASLRAGVNRITPLPLAFAPGSRVLARGEEWLVRRVRRTLGTDLELHVTGLSELVRGMDFVFMTPGLDDVLPLRPEETELSLDRSPGYRRSRLYLESLLRASPPTDARVYLGHQGAMDAVPYQLVPAAKALQQPRPRILIADAVGLGKTIEAGVLLSELIRRGRGRRILVVALRSVLEQLQQELWARFTIPLVRLDSEGLSRVARKLPASANPFYHYDRVILSLDTLKKDEKYRRYLEACHWDVTLIDECQHVAVRSQRSGGSSQRARLAQLLGRTCDALILTSATPHDGRPESFASLMNLLEPTAVADPSDYRREDIAGLYVRRFKKDVAHQTAEAFKPRQLTQHTVAANAAEDAVFALLAEARFHTLQARGAGQGVLFRTTLLKSLLSSPRALRETVSERLHKLTSKGEAAGVAEDRAQLTAIADACDLAVASASSKLERLLSLLRAMGVGPEADVRVVIFSERIATLEMLEGALPGALGLPSEALALFHGSLDDVRQQALVKEFGTADGRVRLLLCSDAAAEGINLHYHCHRLIHFDIPWSLITLEQRNGRIDRFGQAQKPEIHYLLTVPEHGPLRGDLRVLQALVDKEEQAHRNLGDVRWLLNLHEAEAEEDRIAQAISQHEAPEAVLPDLDDLDLDELLGEGSAVDVFGAEALRAEGQEVQAEIGQMRTLYESELQFWREASLELSAAGVLNTPEWHEDIAGVLWPIEGDLERRLAYLPPEILAQSREQGDGVLRLTADPGRVQRALADARKQKSRVPAWQYLWPQHPVAGWLTDRLLATFARHEAPVLALSTLKRGRCAFLMEGVLSNQSSQPVLIDWFFVCFSGRAAPEVVPYERLAVELGLGGPWSNAGGEVDLKALCARRQAAVDAAKAHMLGLRKGRAKQLKPQLIAAQKRLKAWEEQRLSQLGAREAQAQREGRTLRRDERERLVRARTEVEGLRADRSRFIGDVLTTVEAPHVRIAAVMVAQG